MVLTYIWTTVQMVEVKWKLKAALKENKLLKQEQEKLLVERTNLLSPSVIERVAKEKLKMELPARVEFVSLVKLDTEEVSDEGTFELFFRKLGVEKYDRRKSGEDMMVD